MFPARRSAVSIDPAFDVGSETQWSKGDQFAEMLSACGIAKLPWREKIIPVAGRMNKTEIARAFIIVAATAPHHIDYLRQAPVLALQLYARAPMSDANSNKYLSSISENIFRGGPRLRELLQHRGIAKPLRSIHSTAWQKDQVKLLPYFWNMAPSSLAQAIPKSKTRQAKWLKSLERWTERIVRLGLRATDAQALTEWACVTLSDGKSRRDIDTVVDFARACPWRFTSKWSWDKAAEECEIWHRDLAKKKDREAFLKQHGIGWDEKINYLPLPSKHEVMGLSFEALQSGEDIHIEGALMRHCVASYIDRVIRRACFIYSIRSKTKRVATLEIAPASPVSLKVAQIKGPCNSRPRRDIASAAELFVEEINKSLKREAA